MIDKSYLTPNEVAKLLMVSPVTVRQWAQKGKIGAMLTAGGHRRFTLDEVERFAKDRGLSLFRPNGGKTRILIVDDNEGFLNSLAEALTSVNSQIDVDTARDGFVAGHKVHSFRPNILLVDIMMPGLNGIEMCKCIKESPSLNDIRVVAMTGYPSDENVNAILAAGAEKCMAKPFQIEELVNHLGIQPQAVVA